MFRIVWLNTWLNGLGGTEGLGIMLKVAKIGPNPWAVRLKQPGGGAWRSDQNVGWLKNSNRLV